MLNNSEASHWNVPIFRMIQPGHRYVVRGVSLALSDSPVITKPSSVQLIQLTVCGRLRIYNKQF